MVFPRLPSYTGPYNVGTTDIEVPLKELCPSLPSPDPQVTTVSARIFYPCVKPSKKSPPAYWYPNPQEEYFSAYLQFLGTSQGLANVISLFPRPLYSISLPAFQNAPILKPTTSSGRWPTMIFSHGLGGTRNMYSHICGSLASHGAVVIAPEHRDGSAPVSFVRDEEGKVIHTVPFQSISHENTDATQIARNAQLRQRTWELGEMYSLALKLDKGVAFSNYALSTRERNSLPELDLSVFRESLDVRRPGAVHFAGHSFGAVTTMQFVKSVFYDPSEAPASYKPLYNPGRNSLIARQVTSYTNVSLLDSWMLPTLDPTTIWLHDKPLPGYADGGPQGRVILSILSEGFYRWKNNWNEQRRALSPDPSLDVADLTEERMKNVIIPHIFYPTKSAHLSQSDFGVLFPWVAKKAFKAEEPSRTITLNTRAVLEVWRNNGAELADTNEEDMEATKSGEGADKSEESGPSKPPTSRRASDETLTGGNVQIRQDKAILLRDGSIRGWNALGLGPESAGSEADADLTTSKKDAGRIIKEKVQSGNA